MEAVAITYAKALFSLSQEEKNSEAILEQMRDIQNIVLTNKELMKILDSKSVDKETRKELVDKIFRGKIELSLLNFIKLLIDKSRVHNLVQICDEYRKIYFEFNNIKEAKVYSASKLNDVKLNEIKEGLEKKYNSNFVVENLVDEKLVAGVKVVIGDLVLDGSVTNKLERMKSSITI